MTYNNNFEAYCSYLENLTVDQIPHLIDFVSPRVKFSDPFHEVEGVVEMEAILTRLFSKVTEINFRVLERSGSAGFYFFRWDLTGKIGSKAWAVEGVTFLEIGTDGKVSAHREFWDAASQFYEHLPFIGLLLRTLRRWIAWM